MDDGLPDFAALGEGGASEEERASQRSALAALQERVGKKVLLRKDGRNGVLLEGALSERVEVPATKKMTKASQTLVQRHCALCDDALLVFKVELKGQLSLAAELPLYDICIVDRLASHDALAFEVRHGSAALVLEAAEATSKVSWWSTLRGAISNAAPSDKKLATGWLHRTFVRGTLWSAAIEGDEATVRELARYTLTGRQRKMDCFSAPAEVGAFTAVVVSPGGRVQLPPQPVLDIDAQDDDGFTPLHYAVLKGHKGVVEALLEAGARTDVVNGDFETPLHVACSRGDVDIALVLIANGSSSSMRNLLEQTPLMVALMSPALAQDVSGLRRIVEAMVSFGADATSADNDNLAPLHRIALLGSAAEGSHQRSTALVALVAAIIKSGADPAARASIRPSDSDDLTEVSAESYTALQLACGAPVSRYYLPAGSVDDDADEHEESAGGTSVLASQRPRPIDVDLIAALAEHGCPVNARAGLTGETALHLLLRGIAKLQPAGAQAELYARYLSAVQRLIGLGARADIPDATSVTAASLGEAMSIGSLKPASMEALAGAYVTMEPPSGALAVCDRVAHDMPKLGNRESSAGPATSARSSSVAGGGGSTPGGGVSLMFGALSLSRKGGAAKSGNGGASSPAAACWICGSASACACKLCRASVCGACSTKLFPLTAAVIAAAGASNSSGSKDVDSDDDDYVPPKQSSGAGNNLKVKAASRFASGLSALSQALAPPPSGNGAATPKSSDNAKGGLGQSLVAMAAGERVCDACFLLLCTSASRALAEQKAWEIQKAAAQSKAINFSYFAGEASASSLPAADAPPMLATGAASAAPRRSPAASSASGGKPSADAQRAALFGNRTGAGTAAAPPSAAGKMQQQQQRTGALQDTLAETHERLAQRGERLSRLEERMKDMSDSAQEFASLAEQMKKKAKGGWFGF